MQPPFEHLLEVNGQLHCTRILICIPPAAVLQRSGERERPLRCWLTAATHHHFEGLQLVLTQACESESESDNATEGVSWKARDLWSAPVEWSNHEMREHEPSESMQSSAATSGGHPPAGSRCLID